MIFPVLAPILVLLAVHSAGATTSWDKFGTLAELFDAGATTTLSDAVLFQLDGLLTACADAATSHTAFVTCANVALTQMKTQGLLTKKDVKVFAAAAVASDVGKTVADILVEATGISLSSATREAIDACEDQAKADHGVSNLKACVGNAVKSGLTIVRAGKFMTAYSLNEVEIEDEVETSADEIEVEDEDEDNDEVEDEDNDEVEDEDNDEVEDEDNDEIEDGDTRVRYLRK